MLWHPQNLRGQGDWGEKTGFQEKSRRWGLAAGGSLTLSKPGLHIERLLSPVGRWAKAGSAARELRPRPPCGLGGTRLPLPLVPPSGGGKKP